MQVNCCEAMVWHLADTDAGTKSVCRDRRTVKNCALTAIAYVTSGANYLFKTYLG